MWLLWLGNALGEDTLILFEQASLRPGLCAALRIQLTDLVSVSCRPDEAAALDVRIARVAQAVAEEGARLGVLLEPDADASKLRMLVVGAASDRAVLAIEQVESRPERDVDRALALKVREIFEVSMSAARSQVAVILPAPDARVRALLLELGGGVQIGLRAAPAASLALGARFQDAHAFAELALMGRVASSISARTSAGRVREDEWALGVSGRSGWTRGRLSFGPALEIAITRASARGETLDGRRGGATLAFVRLDLALDLRWLLWNGAAPVQLRFAPALQVDPAAQVFALAGRHVLELGRVHAWLPLTLLVAMPWRAKS